MSSLSEAAKGFTISGLLDDASRTRTAYPVVEIPVADISEHPENVAYSMSPAAIESLAESIRRDGLTDLPLVRKCADGSYQMISGHRRRAAYELLSHGDDAYASIPCRVIEGITDEQAVTLLHTANYFVRTLTVTERAAATRALGIEARRLIDENPGLAGERLEDVKAAIVTAQTGRKISGKTIQRQERMARQIALDLVPGWAEEADAGNVTAECVGILARMDRDAQEDLYRRIRGQRLGKQEITKLVKEAGPSSGQADQRLRRAIHELESFAKAVPYPSGADLEAIARIASLAASVGKTAQKPSRPDGRP